MDDDFGDDGWGEDLDALFDDEDDVIGGPVVTPSPAARAPITLAAAAADGDDEGWGDELDDLDDSFRDDGEAKTSNDVGPTPVTDDGLGWGEEDDDIFQDSLEFEAPPELNTPPRARAQNDRLEEVHQELVSYVESLMVLLPSINAVLEAEHNLPEKAAELLHYYAERPQLREYTIEKELPRMEYLVILQHESGEPPTAVEQKGEIAQLFRLHNELDMSVRCANQSLLADLLQVMTGPDGLVRPHYMATCLAETCSFVLQFMPGFPGGLVECLASLVLSLPEPSGQRYPVAKLKVHILLGIPTHPRQQPTIQYKLHTMKIVIPSMEVLRPTAQFLLESGLLDQQPMPPFPDSPAIGTNNRDTFRDVFLQQSQTMLQNSTVGLKSAWKQLDSVAGLQSKMNMVKKILPTTNNSVFEAAMQEQEEFQQQLQAQQQQSSHPDYNPVSYPPTQQPPPQPRPASILGSFMGAIAKSVSLPEEDPSIYDHYAAELQSSNSGGHSPQQGTAFPRPVAAGPPMQLYRREEAPMPAVAPDTLHKFSPAPVSTPATLQPKEPKSQVIDDTKDAGSDGDDLGLNDGWGEEDYVLEDEPKDSADAVNSATPSTAPALVPHVPTQPADTNAVATGIVKQEKYSIEDDIVETRKRWVNPRPGPRRLQQLVS